MWRGFIVGMHLYQYQVLVHYMYVCVLVFVLKCSGLQYPVLVSRQVVVRENKQQCLQKIPICFYNPY